MSTLSRLCRGPQTSVQATSNIDTRRPPRSRRPGSHPTRHVPEEWQDDFRHGLAGGYGGHPPRHGETLGFYIPAQKRSRKAELEAMRAAAKDLDEMIASWGASEDELVEEYKGIRRAAREKKRNAK